MNKVHELSVKIREGKEDKVQPILDKVNNILANGTLTDLEELIATVKCSIMMLEQEPKKLTSLACGEFVTDEQAKITIERMKRFYEQLLFIYKSKADQQ